MHPPKVQWHMHVTPTINGVGIIQQDVNNSSGCQYVVIETNTVLCESANIILVGYASNNLKEVREMPSLITNKNRKKLREQCSGYTIAGENNDYTNTCTK